MGDYTPGKKDVNIFFYPCKALFVVYSKSLNMGLTGVEKGGKYGWRY